MVNNPKIAAYIVSTHDTDLRETGPHPSVVLVYLSFSKITSHWPENWLLAFPSHDQGLAAVRAKVEILISSGDLAFYCGIVARVWPYTGEL